MKGIKKSILLLCGIALLSFSLAAKDEKLERVEPAFWWVGMKNPQLQLMVHGNNIALLQPVITYAGVRVDQVIRVQNSNYLFLTLTILDNVTATAFNIDFQKDGISMARYAYKLLARRKGSAERQGFNNSDLMYLITPDRFVNGDPSNDSVANMYEKADRSSPGGRHGGDIAGIVNSLDYLKDLGFTAIWDNPVLENNQKDYSYHGYAITDFFKVDARFGTNEQYQKMGALASSKGIKHIMDMIVNHCGSEHWWMKDLPTADWINNGNKFFPTNHKKTALQDPYVSDADYRTMSDGWFVETMPDLNQRNPLLATYLIQNAIWWIEYADLDGIRMDTYPYPDRNFMSDWSCHIMNEYPNFNIVGEEWNGNPAIVAFWQKGKHNPNGYVSCLLSLMDFPLQENLAKSLNEPFSWNPSYETLANDFQYANPSNLVFFPDNHDMARFFSQVQNDFGLFKLGIIYTLTINRIPQIYYGTEVLATSPKERNDGLIRSDLPGGWKGDPINTFTNQGLSAQQLEAKAFIKKLANWRKTMSVIHTGKLKHFTPENNVYVYFRYNEGQTVMVVLNNSDKAAELDPKRFSEVTGGFTTGKEVISDKILSLKQAMTVPAKTGWVLMLGK
jgi:glycosidase